MSAGARPTDQTDPMDSTESIDLEAGDTDTRPMNHLEDTMTTPTTAGAPPTAQATAETTTAIHDPGPVTPRRGVRVGTIVWGLVIAAIGVGILAYALDVTFDAQLASIIVIFAAGVLLLVGSIATSRRRRG